MVVGYLTLRNTTDKPKPKVALARQMRRHLTEPEWLLWQRLKLRLDDGLVFKRQKPYGPYILDFTVSPHGW
jgi:adenine-specific DNA-methyltransferase